MYTVQNSSIHPYLQANPYICTRNVFLMALFSNFWASNVLFRKLQKFESALKNRVIESRYKMISRITSTLSGSNINQWFNIFSKCCHFNWKMKIFRNKNVELLTKKHFDFSSFRRVFTLNYHLRNTYAQFRPSLPREAMRHEYSLAWFPGLHELAVCRLQIMTNFWPSFFT